MIYNFINNRNSGTTSGRHEILIMDDIGRNYWTGEGVAAKDIIKELNQVKGEDITVRINSGGGSLSEGFAIYNALRRHTGNVRIEIEAIAASAASVIAMAGDHIAMPSNTQMMIHNPSAMARGDEHQLARIINILKDFKGGLLFTYNEKTGIDNAEISKMLDDETWFTAQAAVDQGFADEVTDAIPDKDVKAFEHIEVFNQTPQAVKDLQACARKNFKGEWPATGDKDMHRDYIDRLLAKYDPDPAQDNPGNGDAGTTIINGPTPAPGSGTPANPTEPNPNPAPTVTNTDPTGPQPEPITDPIAIQNAAIAANMDRINGIQALRDEYASVENVDQIIRDGVKNNQTVDKVEMLLIKARMSDPSSFNIGGQHTPGMSNDIMACAAFAGLGFGVKDLENAFGEEVCNQFEDTMKNKPVGLRQMLYDTAVSNGYSGSAFATDNESIGNMMRFACGDAGIMAGVRNDASTLSLPTTLGNIAKKALRIYFEYYSDVWSKISATRSVTDYKEYTHVALSSDMKFEQVAKDGKLKSAELAEHLYKNQADIFGKTFAITEKDWVNDDLGALQRIFQMMARGAAMALSATFWTVFLDNTGTFYQTAADAEANTDAEGKGYKNYTNKFEGTNTALGIDSLTTADTAIRDMVDPQGDPMMIMGKYLLVGNKNKIPATSLMNDQEIRGMGSKQTTGNPHRGSYEVLVSQWLGNIAKNRDLWALIADPMMIPLIEVAFLNGQRDPALRTGTPNYNELLLPFVGTYSFGVAKQEARAGVLMTGVAAA